MILKCYLLQNHQSDHRVYHLSLSERINPQITIGILNKKYDQYLYRRYFKELPIRLYNNVWLFEFSKTQMTLLVLMTKNILAFKTT